MEISPATIICPSATSEPSRAAQRYAKNPAMTYPQRPGATPGRITIDLGAVARNWAALASLVAPARCAAVVKADAYGLGVARVVPQLADRGCTTFFVATPGEAADVRNLAPQAEIFVLDGLLSGSQELLTEVDAIPCLASAAEVAEWRSTARNLGRRLPAALNLDTGLNRLGLEEVDVMKFAADDTLTSDLDLRLIMSHLASADDPTNPANETQRVAFDRLRVQFPKAPASLAASDGLMLGPTYHYDLVRPGYALYGGQAFQGRRAPVEPVVKVESRVLQVRDLRPGQSVGYSGTWTARRASRIAIIAAGYADGVPRTASAPDAIPGGRVAIHGCEMPMVGRVSMDLVTVDVTDTPRPVARGDLVEIVGPLISLEAAGADARTIGYEMLIRLGRRFERIYVASGVGTPARSAVIKER